jgi:hypothetical protein
MFGVSFEAINRILHSRYLNSIAGLSHIILSFFRWQTETNDKQEAKSILDKRHSQAKGDLYFKVREDLQLLTELTTIYNLDPTDMEGLRHLHNLTTRISNLTEQILRTNK